MRHFLFVFTAVCAFSLSACNTTRQDEEPLKASNVVKQSQEQLRESAQASFNKGDYKKAVSSYYKIISDNPSDYEARYGLAETYLKMGRNNEAIAQYEDLLLAPEYRLRAVQGVGLAELQNGNLDEAEKSLKGAVTADDKLWRSWNALARLYDQKKDWEFAAGAYDKALEYTDRPEVIYNNMGVSYMSREQFEKAAEAFDKALGHKPDLQIAQTNYRLALAMQDRYDEATLVSNVHDEAKALNNAGYTAMIREDYAEAEKLFLKAIEVNPSFYKSAYDNLQVLHHLKQKQNNG